MPTFPGVLDALTFGWPKSAFNSEDFPTFGWPKNSSDNDLDKTDLVLQTN